MPKEHETAIKHVLAAGQGRRTELLEQPGYFATANIERYKRYKELPPLYRLKSGQRNQRLDESEVHFDPFSGSILFPSWYKPGKNSHGELMVIGHRGNNPKDILSVLKINEYHDIEAAIRSCLHRLKNVSRKQGREVQNVLSIASHIAYILDEFSNGKVTIDRIPELALQTEMVLEETGYLRARKPNRVAIAAKMRAALKADSIDRPKNDLRTMVMFAKAWTMSHDENIEPTFAQPKYEEELLSTLLASRSISRYGLTRIQSTLTKHFGLGRDFDGKLHSRRKQLPPNQVGRVVQDIYRVSNESLQDYQIKVAPYRQAALATKYLFFGPQERRPNSQDRAYMIQQLLGTEWFAQLDHFPPTPPSGAGLAAPAFARDVITRGVMAAEMIESALIQGEQGMMSKDRFDGLLDTDSAVDIWSAAEKTFR